MKREIYRKIRAVVFVVAFFMLSVIPAFSQVYQYRDPNGRLCFTNQLSDVPEDQLPEILMKEPKKPADQNPSEPEMPADPPTETPQAKNPDKPLPIPIVGDLNKEKADLEKIHAQLMKRKNKLQKKKGALKTPEQVREYRKKVTQLNDEINAYKKRNNAFQKKADAYNAALREKGEE
ncbi:MAG: DUF4124 domain-containing protein [Deltaproteobacteria bacterium]|nr:DUF4124 domain-containing protein [Deltaproteobacteria bacterium]